MTEEDKVPVEKRRNAVTKMLSALKDSSENLDRELKPFNINTQEIESMIANIRSELSTDPPPHSKKLIVANQAIENIRYLACYQFALSF